MVTWPDISREEVDRNAGRHHHEQEDQDDETGAHLDDAPVVEKVEFDLAGFDHKRRGPLGLIKYSSNRGSQTQMEFRLDHPAPGCSKRVLHPEEIWFRR